MSRYPTMFWLLLLGAQHVRAQGNATWKFPTAGNPISANYLDTVLLDYTSTLNDTILRMWCTPDGGSQDLASSFYVSSTGPFAYILDEYANDESGFPLTCHGELADTPLGGGTDSPAQLTFSSVANQAAKTISASQSASVKIVTTTLAGPTVTTGMSTSPTTTGTGTGTGGATSPAAVSSGGASGAAATTQPTSSASPAVTSSSSSSSHTGAIIGGVIGGLAILGGVTVAVVFLLRNRRSDQHSPPSELAGTSAMGSPSKPRHSFFGFFGNRDVKYTSANTHEDDPNAVHEKDGDALPDSRRVHEVHGSTPTYELPANSNMP